jgi:hypothetical protein
MGAAGFTVAGFVGICAEGLVPRAPGGFCAGGGDCATNVITSASEQAEAMNDVFIVLLNQECDRTVAVQERLYRKIITGESSKTFHFFDPEDVPFTSQYRYREDVRQALGACHRQNSVISRP